MHEHSIPEDLDEGREGDALHPTQELFPPRFSCPVPPRLCGLDVYGQNSRSNAD